MEKNEKHLEISLTLSSYDWEKLSQELKEMRIRSGIANNSTEFVRLDSMAYSLANKEDKLIKIQIDTREFQNNQRSQSFFNKLAEAIGIAIVESNDMKITTS